MSVFTSVLSLDRRILLWSLKQRDRKAFMQIVRMISTSGDGYDQVGAIGLLTLFKHYPTAQLLLFLFAIERILFWVLKNTLRRPRPQESFSSFQAVIEASDRYFSNLVASVWSQVENHPQSPGISVPA
jgi:undecaprenyl-diphosphatase